ncbi:endonuclease domain-containing protein [Brachybacterium huguangmaarense]
MSDLTRRLHVGRRADLLAEGRPRREIDALIRAGLLVPLGRTWLGTAATPPRLANILRLNARATCADALALHGAWDLRPGPLHAALRHGSIPCAPSAAARRLAVADHPRLRTWPDDEPVLPLPLALDHAARCLSPDEAHILFESVAHRRLLDHTSLDGILADLPARIRDGIGRIDARSMSGTESRVRRFLERKGVDVVPQWFVPEVGYTDMLVGEGLIIECDSWEHHGTPAAQAEDRRRDRQLVLRGYRVVRLGFSDVMLRWPATHEFLSDLLAGRLHRVPPGRRGRLIEPSATMRR